MKKVKEDAAVPSRAADISVRYNETKNRLIMKLRQYFIYRGYCVSNGEHIDIVNRILATMEVDATMGIAKEAEGDVITAPEFEEV